MKREKPLSELKIFALTAGGNCSDKRELNVEGFAFGIGLGLFEEGPGFLKKNIAETIPKRSENKRASEGDGGEYLRRQTEGGGKIRKSRLFPRGFINFYLESIKPWADIQNVPERNVPLIQLFIALINWRRGQLADWTLPISFWFSF
ncbi:hypothetical protein GWI33_008230 [Rhynchophorus ferrugineus]|uniref:Uncharacterized protein n=1 Tax=Rhynchophorus ferrugineus TaxID=354439 RepID=A0A834IGD1_RHYFE|nr:hypothetical protein GWI33_008230 [Rhynchophorus ferrugineus]